MLAALLGAGVVAAAPTTEASAQTVAPTVKTMSASVQRASNSGGDLGLALPVATGKAVSAMTRSSDYPPPGCTPPLWVPMLTSWWFNVFKVSFCGTWFWLEDTRTGQSWTEGLSGWFCQHAPSWAIWAVTWGKYTRC
jgi:hypothetical protein